MRFVLGPVPPSRSLDAERLGWTPLANTSAVRFSTRAAVMAIVIVVAANLVLVSAGPEFWQRLRGDPRMLGGFIVALALLVPLHEMIHALAYGRGLQCPELILGVWPGKGMIYVLLDAPVRRNRALWMCVAPFVFLSMLPLALLAIMPPADGAARSLVLFLLLLHTACCMSDFQAIARILRQVPRDALVHNQGWQTYWSRA